MTATRPQKKEEQENQDTSQRNEIQENKNEDEPLENKAQGNQTNNSQLDGNCQANNSQENLLATDSDSIRALLQTPISNNSSTSETLKASSTSSLSLSASCSSTTAILQGLLPQNEAAIDATNEISETKPSHTLQSSRSKTLKIIRIDDQSFIKIHKEPKIELPVLNIQESDLIFCSKEINEAIKKMLGVQESANSPDIVTYNDGLCDIVFSPNLSNDLDFNTLPGKGRACYIFTADKTISYANKLKHKCFSLSITPEKFDDLCQQLTIQKPENSLERFVYIEVLSTVKLKIIIEATKNIHHGMGFYKRNKMAAKLQKNGMIVQEAQIVGEVAGGTNYQVLAHDNFPDTYAVRNENHYVGVFSEYLPGFIPNRDCRLQPEDLTLISLRKMIKKRDNSEVKRLENVMGILKKLYPLLKRAVDPEAWSIVQLGQGIKQTAQYYLGNKFNAYNVKAQLEDYVRENPELKKENSDPKQENSELKKMETVTNLRTITFGEIENLRNLLLGRKQNITMPKEPPPSNNNSWSIFSVVTNAFSCAAGQIKNTYEHEKEIRLIDQAINELNIILLDESALFMKHLHRISSDLHNKWIDIEAEIKNPNSKYEKYEIEEGLIALIEVSLTDVLHYRNRCGLGKGLTNGQLSNDPDRNARNISKNGLNVDAGQAFDNFTSRFNYPRAKKQASDYHLNSTNIVKFPNEYAPYVKHHPTKVDPASAATDAVVVVSSSGLTKNWYTPEDKTNFGLLEDDPIFSFQKYIQHVICLLKTEKMNVAFAELHMHGHLQILNEDGDLNNPLPLLTELGSKQDYRTSWLECVTAKSAEDECVSLTLLPLQKIIERQADFVLELVLESFAKFLADKKAVMEEKHGDAYYRLAEAFDPAEIKQAFCAFREKILAMNLEEKAEEKSNLQTSPQISMGK